jgi:hypothetical protein
VLVVVVAVGTAVVLVVWCGGRTTVAAWCCSVFVSFFLEVVFFTF